MKTCEDSMIDNHYNRCLICLEDHTEGPVCNQCSLGIWHFGDSPSIMRMAAAYVEYNNDAK